MDIIDGLSDGTNHEETKEEPDPLIDGLLNEDVPTTKAPEARTEPAKPKEESQEADPSAVGPSMNVQNEEQKEDNKDDDILFGDLDDDINKWICIL